MRSAFAVQAQQRCGPLDADGRVPPRMGRAPLSGVRPARAELSGQHTRDFVRVPEATGRPVNALRLGSGSHSLQSRRAHGGRSHVHPRDPDDSICRHLCV